MEIGAKYHDTVNKLKQSLRNGEISPLEGIASGHSCYFCVKKIEDGTKMLSLNLISYIKSNNKNVEIESTYFLDPDCYYSVFGIRIQKGHIIYLN